MRFLTAILLALVTVNCLSAEPLGEPWRAEFVGSTLRGADYSSGHSTIIEHDGKVYETSWSSGVAGPTKVLVGTADPKNLKSLKLRLNKLQKVHHQIKAGQRVQGFTIYQGGKSQHFSWEAGSSRIPAELKSTLQAFKSAAKSAK